MRQTSMLITRLLTSCRKWSKHVSTLPATSCQLLSTTFNSARIFLTLLNSDCVSLFAIQLVATRVGSPHLSSTCPIFCQLQNRILTPKWKKHGETLLENILKGKSSSPIWTRICCRSTCSNLHAATAIRFTTWAAQDKNIPHAAAAARNLDAAIPQRSAETELQSTKEELHTTARQIAAPQPDLGTQTRNRKKKLKHFWKGF